MECMAGCFYPDVRSYSSFLQMSNFYGTLVDSLADLNSMHCNNASNT